MKAVWLLIVLVILAGDCTTEHIGVTADERAKVSSAASTVAPRWVLTELRSSNPREEWRVYGSDHANTKYSPLEQITPQNVATLQIAWRWRSADSEVLQRHQDIRTNHYETTPFHGRGHIFLAAGGVQYARWPEAIDMGTWYITADGYFCNT
jgi:glucose dehydrogenase